MKFFKTMFFSFLIILSTRNTKPMEAGTAIAYLSTASIVYDTATIAIAGTAAYFGYEIAAKHFRQKTLDAARTNQPQILNQRFGSIQSLREALHSLRGESKNIECLKML